jgi:hypothetical protein
MRLFKLNLVTVSFRMCGSLQFFSVSSVTKPNRFPPHWWTWDFNLTTKLALRLPYVPIPCTSICRKIGSISSISRNQSRKPSRNSWQSHTSFSFCKVAGHRLCKCGQGRWLVISSYIGCLLSVFLGGKAFGSYVQIASEGAVLFVSFRESIAYARYQFTG